MNVKCPISEDMDLTDGEELKRIFELFKKDLEFKKEFDIIREVKIHREA